MQLLFVPHDPSLRCSVESGTACTKTPQGTCCLSPGPNSPEKTWDHDTSQPPLHLPRMGSRAIISKRFVCLFSLKNKQKNLQQLFFATAFQILSRTSPKMKRQRFLTCWPTTGPPHFNYPGTIWNWRPLLCNSPCHTSAPERQKSKHLPPGCNLLLNKSPSSSLCLDKLHSSFNHQVQFDQLPVKRPRPPPRRGQCCCFLHPAGLLINRRHILLHHLPG